MSYPKPLSEKSLNRLYMQAGLSTETCAFLHSLFAACANLYGTIALRDVWSVYQELKSDVPRIHRRDLIAFSSIVRREVQPYWVYEIEELYTEEPHNDLDRHIVSKELIGAGYGKMFSFYALMDERDDRPYCVPDDFLSYAEPTASVEEKSLADFIGNLKSTAMECAPKQRKTYPNENRGKKLNEFSFLNLNERFNLDYYKKVPATYSALLAEYSGTEAEKIMRFHQRAENVGHLRTTDMIQNVLIELCEVGVRLTEPHNDLDRHIVSKELIGAGYGKMFSFYALMDERDDRPYCVPDDFLSYAEPTASVEEKSLADFIGNLKSTAMECAPKQRKTYPNENRGKKLNEFSFLNLNERFNLDYYKKVPATYSALLAEYSGTEAEKIMRFHQRAENVGHLRTTDMIQNVLIELCEVGVRLTEKQQDTLMQLIVQYHNGSRLWCTCGWKPDELAAKFSGIGAFPGQEASSPEGMMDEKDIIRKMKELGLKVLE